MMKPPFKASNSAINVPWFDMCTVWFVASLSCINMTLVMSCPLVQYQAYNHLALGLCDYKPWHDITYSYK